VDDLVAALTILAQKMRVDVDELAGSFVMYTRISAIVQFIIYVICAYAAYHVINYMYKQYLKANPIRLVKAAFPPEGSLMRVRKEAEYAVLVESQAAIAKIARVVAMALIMGTFFITALCQVSTIINPEGAALAEVMATLKDATKVEIVQPATRSSRKRETSKATSVKTKGRSQ
jgi:hypothetical protein